MGYCPISKENITAPLVISDIELPVWFVNISSSKNALLNTIVVAYE